MSERRCSQCSILLPEEDLLIREDTSEYECLECSGFFNDEDLCCEHDETA